MHITPCSRCYGITVLDLTHMLSGPYGTMMLADLGARTIKVEPPGRGEGTRELLAGRSRLLARRHGRLLPDAQPQQGERLHRPQERCRARASSTTWCGTPTWCSTTSAPACRSAWASTTRRSPQINPRIITCSVTGFGETGPETQRPAFDQVVQGMGGGMSITGTARRRPMRGGIPIGDLGGGMFGAMGVLAALQARTRHRASASTSTSRCSMPRSRC